MRILLIAPPFKRFTGLVSNYFPLGLAYLATVVKRDVHEVRIFEADAAVKPTSLDFTDEYRRYDWYLRGVNDLNHPVWTEIRQLLTDYRPDLVGISSMTPQIASALRVADLCKEYDPDCYVVMGGAHPTVSPEQSIAYPAIDFIVRGEGEIAFSELIKAIDAGARDFSHIKGVSYKQNGQVIHNPPSEFIEELDTVPFPAREDLMNIQNYTSEDMGMLLTSRGCPYRCTYCYHPWKGKVHFRSIDNVIEEIKQVKRDYGTRQFAIKDDTFTVNRRHVTEFCERLIEENLDINWDCTTRVDRVDEKLLKLMLRAGCNVIKVGIETGRERILEAIRKGITLEQSREAATLFNQHGVFWSGYFMMGLPQETEKDILKTYEFMKELNPFYAGLGVYEAFRFTELFDLGVQMGLLYPEVEIEHFYKTRPKDYYFINPRKRCEAITPDQFEELVDFMTRAFHKHNTHWTRMARRGWSRRKAYWSDWRLFLGDSRKAINWILGR